uniref:Uncharacterized protein n=1 Tax=Talaromyces marneffei PM1 TaxID=1077442 RepID=A0A093UTS1_TALMA
MGHPRHDLLQYSHEISRLYADGRTVSQIVDHLREEYNIQVSTRTIERRLKEWKQLNRKYEVIETDAMKDTLIMLFQIGVDDREILRVLREQGHRISLHGLATYRRRLGMRRRISREEFEAAKERLKIIIQEELDSGTMKGFGIRHVYTYLWNKGYFAARRRHDLQRTRGEYKAYGPNYVWSIDGHDKLAHWGFQIYASIDGYSRYITWIYVGISNRAAFSILRQFLDTLHSTNKQPRFIRSDKGSETIYLAAAHYALCRKHKENSQISDCYWYGTSTSNQRIEAWWSQLTKSLLFTWRDYFQTLSQHRLFIRDQRNRPDGVYGRPFMLYHFPSDDTVDYSIRPDSELLSQFLDRTTPWDIDEYLPSETLHWCQSTLDELGFSNIELKDIFPSGEHQHCEAYIQLRDCIQRHITSGIEPNLEETKPPTQEHGFHPDLDAIVDEIYDTTDIEEVNYSSNL